METGNHSNIGGQAAVQYRAVRDQELNNQPNCGKMETKVEIWYQIIRQVVALMYLLAKLNLGYLPPEVKIGKRE